MNRATVLRPAGLRSALGNRLPAVSYECRRVD
jgi:hypothetical protein